MKRKYSKPELDITELIITLDVLNVSDPESSIPEGGGGADPNPFEELIGNGALDP